MARSNTTDVELVVRARNEAAKTLKEITDSLNDLGKTVKGGGIVDAFNRITRSTDELAARQQKLEQILTDAAAAQRKLGQSIRDQEKEYAKSERTISRLGVKLVDLRAKLDIGPLPEAQQRKLTSAINETDAALQREGAELDQIKLKYREAGIPLEKLVQEQRQLDKVTEQTTAELQRMNAQLARNAASTKAAGASLFGFGKNTRQTLAFTQRLRGEIIGLTTAYVGLFGAIRGVSSALETRQQFEAIEGRLAIVTNGNLEESQKLLKQVEVEADRLGVRFDNLADQYSKFAVSASQSNFTLGETNFVFAKVTEAARGARLSTEKIERVFYAMEQIVSKNSVTMEDLRQQLGDALPGAVAIFADSIEKSGEQTSKFIEQGQITARGLIPFANALVQAFGPGVSAAVVSLNAEISRFQNTLLALRREFANDQFATEFAQIIKDLTAALSGPEAIQAIATLREAFLGLARALVVVVENMDTVINVLKVLLATFIASRVYAFAAAMLALSVNAEAAAVKLVKVRKAILGLLIVTAIVEGVRQLSIEFQAVEEALLRFANLALKGAALLKPLDQSFKVLALSIREFLIDSLDFALGFVPRMLAGIAREIAKFAPQLKSELENIATQLENVVPTTGVAERFEQERKDAVGELKKLTKESKEEVTRLNKELDDVLNQAAIARAEKIAENNRKAVKVQGEGLDTGGVDLDDLLAGVFRNSQAKAKELGDSLAKIIRDTERKIGEAGAQSLEDRLKVIENEYEELFLKIQQADELQVEGVDVIPQEQVDRARALINELIKIRQEQEKIKFQEEQLKLAEEDVNKLYAERSAKLDLISTQLASGAITESEARKEIIRLTAEYNLLLAEALAKAILLAEKLGDDALVAKLKAQAAGLADVKDAIITAAEANEMFADGFVNAFDQFIQGTKSASEAFRQFAADFLREIAKMILQRIILNALQNSGFGGAISSAIGTLHTGGIAGAPNGSTKTISPMAFAGAVRYHSGGIAGMAANEVPAILERGEEVITRNDPRHQANGGVAAVSGQQDRGIKIINAIDSPSVLSAALDTGDGTKAMINFFKANRSTVRSLLS